MALSEGGNMSTYGKTVYNPYEQSSQWVEQIKREERIKATHKVLNGDETVVSTYFKGRKPDPGPDPAKNISYYNNYKERPQETLYERTFKVNNDYEPKLHRDDRQHKVGLDLHSEDVGKGVSTIRTNSVYGARIDAPIDTMGVATTHAKKQIVTKEFYDHGPEVRQR